VIPKLLVFGGNGYVGSHVCQAALRMGVPVASVNRSGKPANLDSAWTDQVEWVSGSAAEPDTYRHLFDNCLGVVSCVGAFGSNAHMKAVNGDANVAAVEAAAAAGVQRFAYISAHDYRFPADLVVLKGYFEGKRATEAALAKHFPTGGVCLLARFDCLRTADSLLRQLHPGCSTARMARRTCGAGARAVRGPLQQLTHSAVPERRVCPPT